MAGSATAFGALWGSASDRARVEDGERLSEAQRCESSGGGRAVLSVPRDDVLIFLVRVDYRTGRHNGHATARPGEIASVTEDSTREEGPPSRVMAASAQRRGRCGGLARVSKASYRRAES